MASNFSLCVVCYTDSEKVVLCNNCDEITCLICLKQYKKLQCPSCLKKYDEHLFKQYYEDISNLYIDYYIFDKVPYNDTTNQIIVDYFKEIEIKEYIFWGKKMSIMSSGSSGFSCKKCFVVLDKNGVCLQCKNKICFKCEEDYHEDRDCNPEDLVNIENIRKKCKKCPCCFSYIYRTGGCSHMNCSYCGASFDWNKPHIIQKDKYTYKKLDKIYINPELNKRYNEKYEEMYSKYDKQKKDKNVIFSFNNENVLTFFNNLKKDKTKFKNVVNKLTVNYFSYIKELFNKNQGKNLSQIEINEQINMVFKKKFYNSLKKHQYCNDIYNKIVDNYYSTLEIDYVKNIIKELNEKCIIPVDIQYVFKDETQEIVNKRTINLIKKTKNELFLTPKDNQNKTIKLLNAEQEIHAEDVKNILLKYRFCLNTSHAGSGKTYTSLYVANEIKVKRIILFCPKIMENKWLDVIKEYNNAYKFKLIYFTYSESSSIGFTSNNNVYHTIPKENKICIVLNDSFKELITDETIIIYDEIHNIKSPSSKAFKFISSISEEAIKKKAYVLGISATPIEHKDEINKLIKKFQLLKKHEKSDFSEDRYLILKKKKNSEFKVYTDLLQEYSYNELRKKYNNKEINKGHLYTPAFEFINTNLKKTYDDIVLSFNHYDFRNLKSTLINLIKNYIDSGDSFELYIKDNIPNHIPYYERALKTNPHIMNFINSQKNCSKFMALSYKYMIYLLDLSKAKYKTPDHFLIGFILYLYGGDIIYSLYHMLHNTTYDIVQKLQNEFLNKKIYNISRAINSTHSIEFHRARLLEVTLNTEDTELIDSAFRQVIIEMDNKQVFSKLEMFALMTKGLIISEIVYVKYITNIIFNIIHNKCKIIVGSHYKKSISDFKTFFEELGIKYCCIDGNVKNKQAVIDEFQTNNDLKILICNISCINTGIDLDDKVGDTPRIVFLIPNFKFSETVQFMYRFKRLNSKSEPYIFLMNNHMKIINTLFDKNRINQEINTSLVDLEEIAPISEHDIINFLQI